MLVRGEYLALEMISNGTKDVFVAPRPRIDVERRFWGEQSHQRNQAESRIALRYGARFELYKNTCVERSTHLCWHVRH